MAKEKPPVFGMIQRSGQVVLRVLSNVTQAIIGPIIKSTIAKRQIVYTDEYDVYSQMKEWGYTHTTANHGKKEYARDEDGDGFYEVNVNTMEGCW